MSSTPTRPEAPRQAEAVTCFIAPPYLLARIAQQGTPEVRELATRTLVQSAAIRAQRSATAHMGRLLDMAPAKLGLVAGENLSVYDVNHGGDADLPGTLARSTNDGPVADGSVNEAFDGADQTYNFYQQVFHRDSVDGQGMELVSSVHYGTDFDNAFWNGSQMVYGDGSGQLFQVGGLTKDIDVIAHELTHGVTQFTAGLAYHVQAGALNESISDCFGSMVKQFVLGQSADQADWLIGEGILGAGLHGVALRSMKAPGTAFDGDPQPGDMDGFVTLPDDDDPHNDHGGVHINSGIPNHAFYLAATGIGGNSWETVGPVWYDTLTSRLQPNDDFAAAAAATIASAGAIYGAGSSQQQAVQDAWQQVKVI